MPVIEDYVHHTIGEEVCFIAGSYQIVEEGCLAHDGREFLYLMGIATVDNACCGRTGCRFLLVPGYIHSWKTKKDPQGTPVSEVEPITDD